MKKTLKNLLFLWNICYHTTPGFMIYCIYDAFRQQFLIFLEHTVAIRYVLYCAEHGEPFYKAFLVVAVTLLLYMLAMIPDGYYIHALEIKSKAKLYEALKNHMFEKAAEIDLSCYDNPKYYNEFVLSVAESEKSIDRFLHLINLFFQSVTIILTTGVFFLMTDKVGILFVLVSFVLSSLLANKLNKVNYDVKLQVTPWERKRDSMKRIFYLNEYAKELRQYSKLGDVVLEDFVEANEKIIDEQKKICKKRTGLLFAQNYCAGNFILDGIYTVYLIFQAVIIHAIDYSSAVVLFNRTGGLRRGMNMFAEAVQTASENSMYIDKIRNFIAYEPEIKHGIGEHVPEESGEIVINNLSFRYSENSEEILHNISLHVKPGEKIAIVGYNGAGKTTLVKLLMRLYDPTSGEILYHGKNIQTYDVDEYHRHIGVVFQDYKMYGATLLENVVLSDENDNVDEEGIIAALNSSGFGDRLATLPNGLQTSVTTEFDEKGVNFSGGESQKIAIARALYKNADILIMDEPSSALDPIAEYDLNKTMHNIAKDKTVFYISHRLSTTRDADRIIMLECGRIIEEGTHNELMKKNGKYAQMWNVQAGTYEI